MSHSVDDTYDVYDEKSRTARKQHECDACHEPIRPGHRYTDVRIVWDGDVTQVKRCLKCQTIHLHLREVGNEVGKKYFEALWPDERLNCGEEYKEHWGKEPPPEIARLAFMTADEAQRELGK